MQQHHQQLNMRLPSIEDNSETLPTANSSTTMQPGQFSSTSVVLGPPGEEAAHNGVTAAGAAAAAAGGCSPIGGRTQLQPQQQGQGQGQPLVTQPHVQQQQQQLVRAQAEQQHQPQSQQQPQLVHPAWAEQSSKDGLLLLSSCDTTCDDWRQRDATRG